MSGLDKAAAAFDSDISGGSREISNGVEAVFGNSFNGVEVDDESPAMGGGDMTLPEGVDPALVAEDEGRRPQRERHRAREQVADDADDEKSLDPWSDDVLYADDDAKSEEKSEDEDEDEGDEEGEDLDGDYMDAKVTVTIDGEEASVTVREALDGYIRTETLHRRLNELNAGRDEVEAEARRVVASRNEASAALAEAQEILEAILPKITQDEWDAAFAKDPAKARAMQRSYADIQAKIDAVKQKRTAVDNGTNEQQVQQTRSWIEKEARKFNDDNPQWGNGEEGAKKRQKDLSSMARTAKAVGFTDQEVLGVYDSRMLKVLLKASRYDRMMAARPKPGKGIRTAKPGGGRTPTAPKGSGRAFSELQRTGSLRAAGQVFSEFIKPQPTRRR